MRTILSPLRYPGSKARKSIEICIRNRLDRFTLCWEPFCGGLGFSLNWAQFGGVCIASDLDSNVIGFWKLLQSDPSPLIEFLEARKGWEFCALKEATADPQDVFTWYLRKEISFSGTGTVNLANVRRFQNRNYSKRFKIDLTRFDFKLRDYRDVPLAEIAKSNAFLYLDPPYFSNGHRRLYKNHRDFNIDGFVEWIKKVDKMGIPFVLSIDNNPHNRVLFKRWKVSEIPYKYILSSSRSFTTELEVTNICF